MQPCPGYVADSARSRTGHEHGLDTVMNCARMRTGRGHVLFTDTGWTRTFAARTWTRTGTDCRRGCGHGQDTVTDWPRPRSRSGCGLVSDWTRSRTGHGHGQQAVETGLEGRDEDEELAHETRERRDAGERAEADGEHAAAGADARLGGRRSPPPPRSPRPAGGRRRLDRRETPSP